MKGADRNGAAPARRCATRSGPLPPRAGVGLRHPHLGEFLEAPQPVAWLEVHSENYLGAGGPRLDALLRLRRDYPVSCHGVGLSLGSAEGLDAAHLRRLGALFERVEPALVSEHLAWSVTRGVYLNDLLPLPLDRETLEVVCRNVERAQEAFGRTLLVENPSTYVAFAAAEMSEPEFLAALVRRTGCGLLLDVNNVYVSARNLDSDPHEWLDAMPAQHAREIHLAGHCETRIEGEPVRIDDHGSAVAEPVWALYRRLLARTGPLPTLIERDTNLPPLAELLAEVRRADEILSATRGEGSDAA